MENDNINHENILISVIVPVYNVANYINECLDSLINQTYQNIEILVVDDGSTDESGKICDEYEKKYKKVKVIHKKNEGLGFARNTGLENVHGKYVTFVDSDDYVDKGFIEKLYINMNNEELDMCKSGFRRVDDSYNTLYERKFNTYIYNEEETKKLFLPRMIGALPDKRDSIEMSVCGTLYKTSYIIENNISFPSERKIISEDLFFNIEYMQHINKSATINYIGYNYRCNLSSLTKKYRKDRFKAVKYFYKELKNKLLSLGYNDITMLRLSRIFFTYIKVCLSQEKLKTSNKKYKDSIKTIYEICNDNLVQEIINGYPIGKLGIRQKVFIYLIKYKCIRTIYILSTINLI